MATPSGDAPGVYVQLFRGNVRRIRPWSNSASCSVVQDQRSTGTGPDGGGEAAPGKQCLVVQNQRSAGTSPGGGGQSADAIDSTPPEHRHCPQLTDAPRRLSRTTTVLSDRCLPGIIRVHHKNVDAVRQRLPAVFHRTFPCSESPDQPPPIAKAGRDVILSRPVFSDWAG